jgi:uncharacterized protein (DUF488 family)
MSTIHTIGHSTRTLEDFIAVLKAHGIEVLFDIRAFPMSRRLPHFNRESFEAELPKHGIEYRWQKELGGRRKKILKESPNIALRSDSFRNYADHMLTAEFQSAANAIAALAESKRVAIMCAERVYFNCHRMMVSDYFTANGHEVLHIETEKPPRPHKLMAEAHIIDGQLIYRGDRMFD